MRYAICSYFSEYDACTQEWAVSFPNEFTDVDIDNFFFEHVIDYAYDDESVIGSKEDYENEKEYERILADFYAGYIYDWHIVEPDSKEFNLYEWEEF